MTTGDFFGRVWEMLIGRADGPLAFRLFLQPMVAILFAIRAGLRDARDGRPPFFFWAVFTDPLRRTELLAQVRNNVGKVFVVAIAIDVTYEWIVYHWIYPGQAIIVATLLAIAPYLLIRGPVTRIVGRFSVLSKNVIATPKADTNEEKDVDPRVDLAVVRTELALDRTQLAWVRTTFTLITAGFAIDKVSEALHEARVLSGTNWINRSHFVGITLTAAATLFLMLELGVYYRHACLLTRLKVSKTPRSPLTLVISLLVILLGGTLLFFLMIWC